MVAGSGTLCDRKSAGVRPVWWSFCTNWKDFRRWKAITVKKEEITAILVKLRNRTRQSKFDGAPTESR